MKKFLSLILAAMMLLSVACASADAFDFEADPDDVLTMMRTEQTDELTVNWSTVEGATIEEKEANVKALYAGTAHATNWVGQWELVAAYISEDFAEEYELETSGFIKPLVDKAIVMDVALLLDASNTGSPDGIKIDEGAYWHGHAHDLKATLTFADELDNGGATVTSAWDRWPSKKAVGEQTGFFNFGPTIVTVMADKKADALLSWDDITGVEIEDQDKMKYMGMTTAGYLVLCYSDDNVATKKNADMGICYIFAKAE